MEQVLAMTYLWLKAGHIIFVIFWMAGLFMLPRYFVYHQESAPGSPESAMWVDREAKLLKIILWPSLTVVWVLGLALAWNTGAFAQGWFHAKFALALALSGVHGYFSVAVRAFAEDRNTKPARHWRIVNEAPTILMIGIVILVIVKPF